MFKTNNIKRPSLGILEALYEHDDFMASIHTMVDIGCGTGDDLAWWATRTTRDDVPQPLNIKCVGVDLLEQLPMARNYNNVTYQSLILKPKYIHHAIDLMCSGATTHFNTV